MYWGLPIGQWNLLEIAGQLCIHPREEYYIYKGNKIRLGSCKCSSLFPTEPYFTCGTVDVNSAPDYGDCTDVWWGLAGSWEFRVAIKGKGKQSKVNKILFLCNVRGAEGGSSRRWVRVSITKRYWAAGAGAVPDGPDLPPPFLLLRCTCTDIHLQSVSVLSCQWKETTTRERRKGLQKTSLRRRKNGKRCRGEPLESMLRAF